MEFSEIPAICSTAVSSEDVIPVNLGCRSLNMAKSPLNMVLVCGLAPSSQSTGLQVGDITVEKSV